MGNPTSFLKNKRELPKKDSIAERIKNYDEFIKNFPEKKLITQASRCMECGIPFCHGIGCPLANLIPDFNDLVYKGQWKDALKLLHSTNNFPEITGRICPAPCETSCTLSINDSPVTIKQIELAIVEKGFKNGWIKPEITETKTGKKIAIIGSGPAGLAVAQQLCRAGHTVTVFEKDNQIGGLLRYGIPNFKLEKQVIDRRVKQMEAEGVIFETGVYTGEDISAKYLKKSFDIVCLTCGAETPRDLPVTGRDLEGVKFAMDFLSDSNKSVTGEIANTLISARNKNVVVIGGGDTGSDCVGTAIRQGAKKVYQFEILPKPITPPSDANPNWPNWPTIFRTSSSHEEGCERKWNIMTKKFTGKNSKVTSLHGVEVEWTTPEPGKRPQLEEKSGSEFEIKTDLILLAMGFLHVNHHRLIKDLNVDLDQRGNVIVDDNYCTSIPGVFAAGDTAMGASLVVKAIAQGRQMARAIDFYLMGTTELPSTSNV